MADLRALYQEVIAEHNRNPRNFRWMQDANRMAVGVNPLCGDKLTVYMKVDENDTVIDVSFEGSGCAISVSSASIMTQMLKGRKIDEAEQLFKDFHEAVTREDQQPDLEALGKIAVLAGVKAYPSRVKCATLSWHTMHAALEGEEWVSTE
ncbi:MAG: SUF system NifU family Fe-S cluster assembly protein [Gammaproteobacteria bacterium]|nr:SUF system NifU family Fe-S cluster assembly protein [Gammaproteobacteria bacterium]